MDTTVTRSVTPPSHPLPANLHTLVHLGAGRCRELDTYLTQPLQRLVLLEADPQLAAALRTRIAATPTAPEQETASIQVLNTAVAGQAGTHSFYRYNLPDVSSLHAATGLLALFPGLKTVQQFTVDTVNPAELVEPLALDAEQDHSLVIDVPGEEYPILQALEQAEQLHRFCWLQLYCGREALYENSVPAQDIVHWLGEQGFDVIAEDSRHDPDRPCWTLQRNNLALRNRLLRQQVATIQRQLSASQQQIAALSEEREVQAEQISTLKQQLQDYQKNKKELIAQRDEHIKTGEQLQKTLAELTKERDTARQQVKTHQAEIDKHTQRIKSLEAQRHEHEQHIAQDKQTLAELTKERDIARQQVKTHQAEIDKHKQAAQDQQQRIKALEAQCREWEQRHTLIQEEMLKAEAQIDLIKEMWLRDQDS